MVGLSDSLEVKGLLVRNRIVMPPMYTGLASGEGAVTEDLIEHYVQRSKAVGLMFIEHSFVSLEGKVSESQLAISDENLVKGLENLSASIHALETPVVIQINHAGRSTDVGVTGMKPVGPSPTDNARELRCEEIEALTDTFAAAAERAMRAGFDGVEVHGAHGFLLNQFFSPLANHRRDDYGGSLENRMRFPLEVVERVKEKVGGRLLLYRLGSDDLDPAGTTVKDSRRFALKLEEAGVDVIDVSGGMCGSRPSHLQGKQGYFIPQAEQIKEAVSVPVIGVGGITDPEVADRLVHEGKVDLVAVGREFLKDSTWAMRAIETLEAD